MKVGDRIFVTKDYNGNMLTQGKIGTILMIYEDEDYAIEFTEHILGHDCGHLGKKGHCWFVPCEYCIPVFTKNSINALLYKRENKIYIEVE